MSDLLLQWLNNEVVLSQTIKNIVIDFANGYLLGEILYRYNQQHNFTDFMNCVNEDAKIINFCLLEPSLRSIGIRFNSTIAGAIMNEKNGAATNVLYQIKMATVRLGLQPPVSTKSLSRHAVYPLPNTLLKLPKPIYDQNNHNFFEHSIRRHIKSRNILASEKHEEAEIARKRNTYLKEKQMEAEELAMVKAERLHLAYIRSRYMKIALDETASPAWHCAMQEKRDRLHRKAKFEQEMREKRQIKMEIIQSDLRRQVKDELLHTESWSRTNSKMTNMMPRRKSLGYGLQSLSASLRATENTPIQTMRGSRMSTAVKDEDDAKLNMNKFTLQRQRSYRARRKEIWTRHRKQFVQQCVTEHYLMDDVKIQNAINQAAFRLTKTENEFQRKKDYILMYEEVACRNRNDREKMYAIQRADDLKIAIQRDNIAYNYLHDQCIENKSMQQKQIVQWRKAEYAARHYKATVLIREVVLELISFGIAVIKELETFTLLQYNNYEFLNSNLGRDMKYQLIRGKVWNDTSENRSDDNLVSEAHFLAFLDRCKTDCYPQNILLSDSLNMTTEWSWNRNDKAFRGENELIEGCYVFGELIMHQRWLMKRFANTSSPNLMNETELSNTLLNEGMTSADTDNKLTGQSDPTENTSKYKNTPNFLRIVLFGPSSMILQTQATMLANVYNLQIISFTRIIKDAIDSNSALGNIAHKCLQSGCELEVGIYAQLVSEATQTISKTSESKKKGWVLYDFPSSRQHMQALEFFSAKYEDPNILPSPYDEASIIAPGQSKPLMPSTFMHHKSCFDLVIYLNQDEDSAANDNLGHLEDIETTDKYHIFHDPPPNDSTTRYRLRFYNNSIHPNEFDLLESKVNTYQIAQHESWISSFGTWRQISAPTNATPDYWWKHLHTTVEEYLMEQAKREDDKERQTELIENILMSDEESDALAIFQLDNDIKLSTEAVAAYKTAFQAAEETKLKKVELVELKATVDAAQQDLNTAVMKATAWHTNRCISIRQGIIKFTGGLTPNYAKSWVATWDIVETAYSDTMKETFSKIRIQKFTALDRAKSLIEQFCEFLRRPDEAQSLIDTFHRDYNTVDDDMRMDTSTKEEFHARVDVLQDNLERLFIEETKVNEDELSGVTQSMWFQATSQKALLVYHQALQGECDRFRVTLELLIEAFHAACSNIKSDNDTSLILQAYQLLTTNAASFDLVCKIFHDPSISIHEQGSGGMNEVATITKKAKKTGKQKQSTSNTPAVQVSPPIESSDGLDSEGEVPSIDILFEVFDDIKNKCNTLWDLIKETISSSVDHGTITSTEDVPNAISPLMQNFIAAINYEFLLMKCRIDTLHSHSKDTCNELTQIANGMAATLTTAMHERQANEAAAIASLIKCLRQNVEDEMSIPFAIQWRTFPPIPRFPVTKHLKEDTLVRININNQIVPPIQAIPSPDIELNDENIFNSRQIEELRNAFKEESYKDNYTENGKLPIVKVLEILRSSQTMDHAFPINWQLAPDYILLKLAIDCMDIETTLVDLEKLLQIFQQETVYKISKAV